MSRALALFLMIILLPGLAGAQGLRGYDAKDGYQYIALGTWPQDESGEASPILWRVLAVNGEEALLFSEYVLGNGSVHGEDKDDYMEYVHFGGVWKLTEMYDFLNETFMPKAFSEGELSLLMNSEELGTIFLLSSDELSNKAYGFLSNKERMGKGTPYALANGLFKYSTKFSPYWTRTQSTKLPSGARCTKVDGSLGYIRVVVKNEGWRPACRINLSTAEITSGEGTMESPYVFSSKKRP
jgi:hypothetical protein